MSTLNETLNSTAPNLKSDHIYTAKKLDFLKSKISGLNELCQEIDPYNPISEKHQNLLKEYGIFQFNDPFEVTNKLVIVLEDSIEEFEKLEKTTQTYS